MDRRVMHTGKDAASAASCLALLFLTYLPAPAQESDGASFCGDEVTDLESIRGKSFKSLELMATRALSDISPVRGMKLEKVNLWKTKVADLSPLKGMPIRELTIYGGRITDLTPLAGMPLEYVWIGEVPVKDISPLKGAPLKSLNLNYTEVSDLSPLKDMPLEYLHIQVLGAGKITDLTPLAGMKLKALSFHANTVTKGIGVIRNMESLEQINHEKPAQFWWKYDQDEVARVRLRERKIEFRELGVDDDGTWSLTFHADEMTDLKVLKNLPISYLCLGKSPITDLSPLQDTPIKRLWLNCGNLRDLSGLANTSITFLRLNCPLVDDISPLRNLSLNHLSLRCPKVTDISPLKNIPLRDLALHCPKIADISVLRGMPLKDLDIGETGVTDLSPIEGAPLEMLYLDKEIFAKNRQMLHAMKQLETVRCPDENGWFDTFDPHEEDDGSNTDPFAPR